MRKLSTTSARTTIATKQKKIERLRRDLRSYIRNIALLKDYPGDPRATQTLKMLEKRHAPTR